MAKKIASSDGPTADTAAVDPWIASEPDYARPILNYLRDLIHEAAPDAVAQMKWSRPFYLVNGTPICYLAAFKQHCGFGFWSPDMTEVLKADGIAEPGASGSFGRISSIADLPPADHLLRYLRHAADLARTGSAKTPMASGRRASAKAPIAMPTALATALAQSAEASAGFQKLSASCRREYFEWITSAKSRRRRTGAYKRRSYA